MSASPKVFTNVQKVRSFDGVIDQIRRAILSGEIAPGDRLPNERELASQLGVSRTTLREGLRALESQGLLVVRLGTTGGIFVAVPDAQIVGVALDSMMHLRHASRWEMQEYRRAFEPENAHLAALRATKDDLERFDQETAAFAAAVAAGHDLEAVRAKCRVHEAVAKATHNAVRTSIMVALSQAVIRAAEELPDAVDLRALELAIDDVRQLINAIENGDPALASTIMRERLIWT